MNTPDQGDELKDEARSVVLQLSRARWTELEALAAEAAISLEQYIAWQLMAKPSTKASDDEERRMSASEVDALFEDASRLEEALQQAKLKGHLC